MSVETQVCNNCWGVRFIKDSKCPKCDATGYIPEIPRSTPVLDQKRRTTLVARPSSPFYLRWEAQEY